MASKKKKQPRAQKPAPMPNVPGKRCPNCNADYVHPVIGDYSLYVDYNEVPHENPFDCIRHLAKRLRDAESEIEDLQSDLRAVERGSLGEGLA